MGKIKNLPKTDLLIICLLMPVILQSALMVGITMFGFIYSFLR